MFRFVFVISLLFATPASAQLTRVFAKAEARAAAKAITKSELREAAERVAQRSGARPHFDPVQRGIPESWVVTATKKEENRGLMYYDPAKKKADHIRDMPGNPKNPYKNAQQPHVRWQRNGRALDKHGNVLKTAHCEAAHIPTAEFRYSPPKKK